ncbi:hypothetical protein ID0233_07930 [Helicobacter pylori]
MPLPFILGGLAIAAAGYGVKKGIDAKNTNDEAKDRLKKAEERLEETKKRVESAEFGCKLAFARFGEKKLHVRSYGMSRFVEHFNQLKGHEFVISNMDMQNIQEQVSEALNVTNKCKEMGLSDLASLGGVGTAVGVLATYGAYTGISAAAGGMVLSSLGGALAWMSSGAISLGGGLAAGSMALIGELVAGPALAILGAVSTDKMEEKLEKAKAYYSQIEESVKKADAIIDQFQAIEKMAKFFTRQITKCDALFSLSQDAIATMRKHNYNHSLYSQEERDQLCVTVSTLMTLSAFLKVPIIDKHQKLQEKAKRALEIMERQMDSLESGHYNVAMIQSRQKDLENL